MWHTLVKAISSTPSRHNILGTYIKYLYIEVRHWRSLSANHLEVLIHGVLFGKHVSKGRFGKEKKMRTSNREGREVRKGKRWKLNKCSVHEFRACGLNSKRAMHEAIHREISFDLQKVSQVPVLSVNSPETEELFLSLWIPLRMSFSGYDLWFWSCSRISLSLLPSHVGSAVPHSGLFNWI